MRHVEELLARERADLSHAERHELTAHLATCADCRSLASALDRNDGLLSAREPQMPIPALDQLFERRQWALPALLTAGAALVLLVLVVAPLLSGRSADVAGPRPGMTAAGASPSASPSPTVWPEPTKPPWMVAPQSQLPLVTSVRWAVDRRSGGTLLVLFYEGYGSSFRVVDAGGATVLQVPLQGSGIFGPETCVARRQRQEGVTWVGVDEATLESFAQRYRTYRVIAEGIPAGEVMLPLVDSGCRGPL